MTSNQKTAPGYNPEYRNGFKTEIGALDWDAPARASGKKAFDWKFIAKGAGTKPPVDVAVNVESANGMLQFRAHCSLLVGDFVNSDINLLHAAVEAALLEKSQVLTGIDWQDWLEIAVTGDSSDFQHSRNSSMGADLKIQVHRLKRGVHPETGAILTLNANGVVVPFPKATSFIEQEAEFSKEKIRINTAAERSYVPATQENLLALQVVMSKMGQLRADLMQLLSQGQVAAQLALGAAGIPGLMRLVEPVNAI